VVDQGGTLDLSITCEERRGERGERGEERGGVVQGGDKRRGGTNGFIFTFGTPPRYHHVLGIVVHVGANFTGSIPSERATLKCQCAAARVVKTNCPSPAASSIVNECDEDQVDDGVLHIQPSTIASSISISDGDGAQGSGPTVVLDGHNALPSYTLPNTRPLIRAACDGRVLVTQR